MEEASLIPDARAFSPRSIRLTLAGILLAGLLLRLYQLSTDSFWVDEVGVALAARAATFARMLEIAHGHIMAMPLDYTVAWLVGRLTVSEVSLRLPAVLWGTLSILIAYLLFSRLGTPRIGLLAALILALSPFHVQYSQEARFYSPLVFFYLLATWLLLRAAERPTPRNWTAFTAAMVIGILFHVYVVLVLITGAGWLWISLRDSVSAKRRVYFIRSASFVLMSFIAALLFFGSFTGYDIPLLSFGSSLLELITTGLGWVPFYPGAVTAWLFGGVCAILGLAGIGSAIRRSMISMAATLLFALIAQLSFIIGVDFLKHYFASPRQLLIGLPVMCFFTALGIEAVARRLFPRIGFRLPQLITIIALVVTLTSLPALENYYRGDKGRAREIAHFLLANWEPGEQVYFLPDFAAQAVAYYARQESGESPILAAFAFLDWNSITDVSISSGPAFLLTSYDLTVDQQAIIRSLKFKPVVLPEVISRYSYILWKR
jgi:mannosyltransferase